MQNKITTNSPGLDSITNNPSILNHNLDNEVDINQVHKDFYELFTTNPNKDMLKYAYQDPSFYEAVTKSPGYYLFRDEISLIQEHKKQISDCLSGIETIIEFGPGSENGLNQKTLPMLGYALDLKKYGAVDISQKYLDKIGQFVKAHTNLEVDLVQADFTDNIPNISSTSKPRLFMMLGSTISGFDLQQDQGNPLKNIHKIMNSNDIFIMTADTNLDSVSLLKAYDNLEVRNLIKEIWKFYSTINPEFDTVANQFTLKHIWNKDSSSIEFTYTAANDIEFSIHGYGKVKVNSGQSFNVGRSHKFKLDEFSIDIKRLKFNIYKVLKYNDMCMLIVHKT